MNPAGRTGNGFSGGGMACLEWPWASRQDALMADFSPSPRTRFSNRVDNYVRYRPGYPPAVLELLSHEAGLTEACVVADVGSGTGISTDLLLKSGAVVYAVEPNLEMRQAAERLLSGQRGFRSVAGSAQATTLPRSSVDLITAAQAFHWFNQAETRAEFSRILKPGGRLALIWNERRMDSTPFLRAYENLLLDYAADYATVRHENTDAGALAGFFIGPFLTHSFYNEQRLDYESLTGRLLSSSYAPAERQPGHDSMIAELRRIFELCQENGTVVIEYTTKVHLGR